MLTRCVCVCVCVCACVRVCVREHVCARKYVRMGVQLVCLSCSWGRGNKAPTAGSPPTPYLPCTATHTPLDCSAAAAAEQRTCFFCMKWDLQV